MRACLIAVPASAVVTVAATAAQVPKTAAALAPGVSKVPAGQAVVTDTQLPGQVLSFTGKHTYARTQSFITSKASLVVDVINHTACASRAAN